MYDDDLTVEKILACKVTDRLTLAQRAKEAVKEAEERLDNIAAEVRYWIKEGLPEHLMDVLELTYEEARSIAFAPTEGKRDRVVFFTIDGLRFRADFSNESERTIRVCMVKANNCVTSQITSLGALGKMLP